MLHTAYPKFALAFKSQTGQIIFTKRWNHASLHVRQQGEGAPSRKLPRSWQTTQVFDKKLTACIGKCTSCKEHHSCCSCSCCSCCSFRSCIYSCNCSGSFLLNVYTQKLFSQEPLHIQACTRRYFHTQKPFAQQLLHSENFTHKGFCTEKLLHRGAFAHRRLYAQKLLHRGACTHTKVFTYRISFTKNLYTQKQSSFYMLQNRKFTAAFDACKGCIRRWNIAILLQFLTFDHKFARKGCVWRWNIASLLQFFAFDDHFLWKCCV